MTVYNTAEAKARLPELLKMAARGEDVVIAHRGKPLVKLVPVEEEKVDRSGLIGIFEGKIVVSDDAFDPEPEDFWFPKDDILLK
jgi:prevent-host-death family protein